MTDRMEVSDMGRKKQISDQRRLYTEKMRLQKGYLVLWLMRLDISESFMRISFKVMRYVIP